MNRNEFWFWRVYQGDERNLTFPDGTKAIIGDELRTCGIEESISPDSTVCFSTIDMKYVETIDMPDSVEIIGPKTFNGCHNLKKVNFSKNLKKICLSAFLNCTSLKSITLPKSLKVIETWTFGNYDLDDIFYDGTIFDFDKIDTRGAFKKIGKLHCSNCTVDFTQKDYYIKELKYDGSIRDWNYNMSSHWLNRRSAKIICTDGEIDNRNRKQGKKISIFPKISAPFGRKTPKDRLVDTSVYTKPWVESLRDVRFFASEKIDGICVGIVWDGDRISFVGHTEKSKLCQRYLNYLKDNFGTSEFESVIEEIFGDTPVTIFGEGISKDYNVHYGFPDGNFIMYDIQNEKGTFYNREAVRDIAQKLALQMPYEEMMTLDEAIAFVKTRPMSRLNPTMKMEGLVLRAPVEMYTNSGERIICKLKVKDFVEGVKD